MNWCIENESEGSLHLKKKSGGPPNLERMKKKKKNSVTWYLKNNNKISIYKETKCTKDHCAWEERKRKER